MTAGLEANPGGTVLDRALSYLTSGPTDSGRLARYVLGIPRASPFVADRLAVALLGADPRVNQLGDGRWILVSRPEQTPALKDCTFAVVDVETTGLRPAHGDRITEIAVAVVRGDGVELVLDTLVNPERVISTLVSRVTRITNQMVREQPAFREIADRVVAALAGRIFVAHNVGFDWRFVGAEVRRSRHLSIDGPRLCTAKLARRLIPGLKSRSLDSAAAYYGIPIENRHRAGSDAFATGRVLTHLLAAADERGIHTLHELTRYQAPPRRKRNHFPPPWRRSSESWRDPRSEALDTP